MSLLNKRITYLLTYNMKNISEAMSCDTNKDRKERNTLVCTSWKLIWSYKFFEKFIGTCHFVQVHRVIRKPELERTTFLQNIVQQTSHNAMCV